MPQIILSTLNARYIHSAFGLRYLQANMGKLQPQTEIREYTLQAPLQETAEQLLAYKPKIIGFGVYIWNILQTTELVALIKTIAPEVIVVVGGPEVSYEWEDQRIVHYADYLITGQADLKFAAISKEIVEGRPPEQKVHHAMVPELKQIASPYGFYNDEDIAHRIIYVEASRGCPFKCEFCLSALDKTSTPFDQQQFLKDMEILHQKGVRHFKFVDRTFNLNVKASSAILEFFLERMDEHLFLHFEVIPDRLPEKLKKLLARFPEGSLQLEVGIQTLNPEVQKLISRKQDNKQSRENLAWLRNQSTAHIHSDLIIGLPGEDIESFGKGFNEMVALNPHEIQVGILKRLKGSPVIRHTEEYQLLFNPTAPYDVLSTSTINFETMQQLKRFARYWDMIGNSGHFTNSLKLILDESPFDNFLKLSIWLYETTQQTAHISLKRLYELVYQGMQKAIAITEEQARAMVLLDYEKSGVKGLIGFMKNNVQKQSESQKTRKLASKRQQKHV